MKIRWTAAPVLTAAMITAALGSLSSETALASSGPAGTGQPIASLNAVTADGTLAVGADSISTFLTPLCGEDLAELRGSKGWTALRTPSPPVCGWLDSVTALPHKRAWAVGYQLTKTAAVRTLTEYYNGSRWTIEPSPNPAKDNQLRGVTITRSGTVWAVGSDSKGALILKREGSRWVTQKTSLAADLNAVTVTPGGQLWAVGSEFDADTLSVVTVTATLTSSGWHQVPSPSPGGEFNDNYLTGVAAGPHNALLAVGYYYDPNTGLPHQLALKYAAGKWSQSATPSPAGSSSTWLYSVAVTSSGGAWAAGAYDGAKCERTMAEQYAGGSWHLAAPLNRGKCDAQNANAFYGVTVSGGIVYAVGESDISTLAERYSGARWQIVKSGN